MLISTTLSVVFLEKKKIYFQSIEVGNKFLRYYGNNSILNQIFDNYFDQYNSKFQDIVLKTKYDFIWDYEDNYAVFFFSNDLNELNKRVKNIKKKINKLNFEFKKLFKDRQSFDYLSFKEAYLNQQAPLYLKDYMNKTHLIHIKYSKTLEKFDFFLKIVDNEDVIYIDDKPQHLEYLYSNLNDNFIFKFIFILLITSIISFILIKRIQQNDI